MTLLSLSYTRFIKKQCNRMRILQHWLTYFRIDNGAMPHIPPRSLNARQLSQNTACLHGCEFRKRKWVPMRKERKRVGMSVLIYTEIHMSTLIHIYKIYVYVNNYRYQSGAHSGMEQKQRCFKSDIMWHNISSSFSSSLPSSSSSSSSSSSTSSVR